MGQKLFVISIGVVFFLGLWGQYEISPDNLSTHLTTSLYQVLMLFFFAGEWTLDLAVIPIQIELARFLAPVATLTSLIFAYASATRTSLVNYSVRFYKGHIIVVGLGEKCWQFIRTCNADDKIVVVEREPENLLIARAREHGVKVLVGDIFQDGMFETLNLHQASELIAFTGNDGANVEFAIKARDHVRLIKPRVRELRIHIHLNEIGLAHHLEGYPKFFADYPTTQVSFFSVYDLSARLLLQDCPPEIYADVAGHSQVHLAIYGFKRLAEKFMIEAALTCQYANGSRLKFIIFDDDAANKEFRLRSEHPYLERICDFEFVQQSIIGPHIFERSLSEILPKITQHIICKDSDEESLSIALMLRVVLLNRKSSNAPIMVRMQQSSGLAQLLESNTGEPEIPDGLYPFGMLDQVLHRDNILSSDLDKLARSIHDMYLDSKSGGDPRSHHAMQGWNDLPEWERKQNLLQADHWQIKLRAVRCRQSDKKVLPPQLTDQEAETQATMEHNRYVNTKYYDGWRYGDVRVEDAKINPFLTPWINMDEKQRQQEIEEARKQPLHFSEKAGIHIQRSLVIGVSGHRLHKLDVDNKQLEQQVIQALEKLGKRYPNHQFVILSPLAEGADRLVAKLAMRVLNAALQVPLPLPYDLYVADFRDNESVEEFKILVGKAEYYYEMPMKFGNVRELANIDDSEGSQARSHQYALVGAYVVQRSDELIALWDGLPEDGIGGTAQIVRWFDSGKVDESYAFKNHYFLPPEKTKTIVIDVSQQSDRL